MGQEHDNAERYMEASEQKISKMRERTLGHAHERSKERSREHTLGHAHERSREWTGERSGERSGERTHEYICDEDEEFQQNKYGHISRDSRSFTQDNFDRSFSFDATYILKTYLVTSQFFDEHEVGKFITDIDGMCLYVNGKGVEFIGESRKRLLFKLFWSYNIYNDDILAAQNEWHIALKNESSFIYKERRIENNKIKYLIVEAHPVFSGKRCKGMKGIMLRVTKPLWLKCDTKIAMRLLNNRTILEESPGLGQSMESIF